MVGKQPKFKYIFLGSDIAILLASFFWASTKMISGFWSIPEQSAGVYQSHFVFLVICIVVFISSFLFNNLYKRNIILSHYRQFILILKSLLIGSGICTLFMIVLNFDLFVAYGKQFILYFFLFTLILFIILRVFLANYIYIFFVKKNIYQRNLLIIGGDAAGRHVLRSLETDPFSEFEIRGILDDYKDVGAELFHNFQNLGKLCDIEEICRDMDIDEILITIDNAPYERITHIVENCLGTGKVVRIYSDLLDIIAEKISVEFYSNIPVIMLSQLSPSFFARSTKKILDVLLSLLLLILLFPLFVVVAIIIKLSSKGPVLFKQTRIGKNGKPFNFYKFRSMHIGKDDSSHREYVKDFINGKVKDKNINIFKMKNDPRIFSFGKFIRKTSIDEFPQLFNVLEGNMTLVGPRPSLPYEWALYDETHKQRLNVTPGLYWTVAGIRKKFGNI